MLLPRRILLRHAFASVGAAFIGPVAAHERTRHANHHHHQARPLPLVVIDPGHGGKDPGCSGHRGTQEKTVALELGLELRRQLHAGRRCRVEMTRSTDVFVPLGQRVRFARGQRAALFVSLHANAARDHGAHGACVYRFAYRASDAKARALATWENSADRYGGPAFRHASPALTHILASLMRKETWKHSAWLQEGVVDAMHQHVRLTPVPARHARFVVLSAPDIASVLVEIGFLTNPKEERLLRAASHRHRLALALRHAVEHTLARLPHDGVA